MRSLYIVPLLTVKEEIMCCSYSLLLKKGDGLTLIPLRICTSNFNQAGMGAASKVTPPITYIHNIRGKCWWYGWRGMSLNSSMRKKWHSLTFTNTCWTFMETKQWMWAQWWGGWCISAVTVRVGHLHWPQTVTSVACRYIFISAYLMVVAMMKNSVL